MYSVGRYSASSIVASTLTAVVVLYHIASCTLSAIEVLHPFVEILCRPSRFLRRLRKYSVGRESISAVVYCTLSAVVVFHPVVSRTLSAVIVFHPIVSRILSAVTILAQTEEVLCRPSECFLDLKREKIKSLRVRLSLKG